MIVMEPHIDRARPDDANAVFALLAQQHLPPDGLLDHLPTMLVARHDGYVVGSAALEIYADGALLRSVAVASAWQRRGLGRDLIQAAIRLAQERRIAAIYLLTMTAETYFPKFGFESIARSEVPESVQASIEFTSACCSSASVMVKRLDQRGAVSPSSSATGGLA